MHLQHLAGELRQLVEEQHASYRPHGTIVNWVVVILITSSLKAGRLMTSCAGKRGRPQRTKAQDMEL